MQQNWKESLRKFATITAKRTPGVALGTQKVSLLRPGGPIDAGQPGHEFLDIWYKKRPPATLKNICFIMVKPTF